MGRSSESILQRSVCHIGSPVFFQCFNSLQNVTIFFLVLLFEKEKTKDINEASFANDFVIEMLTPR